MKYSKLLLVSVIALVVVVLLGLFVPRILAIVLLSLLLLPDILCWISILVDPKNESEYKGQFVGESINEEGRQCLGVLGKQGIAVQALRPVGKVEIDGNFYEARADAGFIDVHEHVVVVKENPLTVKKR